jgi:hypothetical protein
LKSKLPCALPLAIGSAVSVIILHSASAAVEVLAPIAITRRVEIQPIRVKKTDGTTAVTLGDTAQSTYIKEQINRIWAQVGVRIDWLPFTEYINNFAYEGSGGSRPTDDLDTIVDTAGSPPKSSNAIVINMFFVEIVPGFGQTSDNSANGLAYLDFNGITMHVGANLLGFEGGRDVIAGVIAHEIGHNLGLDHTGNNQPNLMSPGGTTDYLTTAQRSTVFTDDGWTDGFDFLQVLPPSSNYQQWATTNGVDNGPDGDDDSDGIDNVIEFMLSRNPNVPDLLPAPVTSANGITWTLAKNSLAVADGLVYQIQTRNNLNTWLAAGAANSGSTVVTNNATTLTVRLNSGGGRGFMRLKVDSTPVAGDAAVFFPPTDPGTRIIAAPIDEVTLTPP